MIADVRYDLKCEVTGIPVGANKKKVTVGVVFWINPVYMLKGKTWR